MTKFNHNTGNYLNIAGANIYYEEIGNKDNPALVILHGGFQNIEDMNPILFSHLTDGFRVIGIDSRGHGKSTLGSEPLTYERIQLDVEAILTHLNIESVSIIGFSDGGITGFRITANKSVKVKKLIAIGASWSSNDLITLEPMFRQITPTDAKVKFADSFNAYKKLNPEPQFDTFVN